MPGGETADPGDLSLFQVTPEDPANPGLARASCEL